MRFALGIEYIGSGFSGWQSQAEGLTIQSTLEQALSRVADHRVQVICAGRTDAGVHAKGQVVHFDTSAIRSAHAFVAGSNTYLPRSVCVRWAMPVDETFNARFSALSRRYCYVICNRPMHSALTAGRATWYRHPLDIERMQHAANYLIGEHDFNSFRSSQCESRSSYRCIHAIDVRRQGEFVIIDVQANAFLHHMVRNIVGSLMRVGAGFKSQEWMGRVLLARDRKMAAETAAADGLYLMEVAYPAPWDFPMAENVLLF